MARLIALCSAVPRSGKGTVADILCDLWDEEYKCYYKSTDLCFAEALKEMLEPILRHIKNRKYYEYEAKTEVIPEIGKSYRQLCRTLGDSWGRKMVGEDFWVNTWERTFNVIDPRMNLVTCSDLRYRNEYNKIRSIGGEIWFIHRSQAMKSATKEDWEHNSENNIKPEECDRIIYNDYETIDELRNVIQSLNPIQNLVAC